jgi:8-oxo-dGTP diphosphatase
MSGPPLAADVVALAGVPPRSVLLIERGFPPFKGSWALPGGFVEAGERMADAAARELAEETGIEAGELTLLGIYDDPDRDPRGPTVSVVQLMHTEDELEAAGGDDAADARWFALDALPELAFDHAQVIADALSFAARGQRS